VGELLQPTHLIVVLIIALLVFGPSKLPELGKGLGEAIKGFKSGLRDPEPATAKPADAQPPAATPKV
jgi:sec-independent protein translocase protein TatA